VAPNILSINHWDRLLGGELYAPLSRADWALLLLIESTEVEDLDIRASSAPTHIRHALPSATLR
jgi:hypothetical protein